MRFFVRISEDARLVLVGVATNNHTPSRGVAARCFSSPGLDFLEKVARALGAELSELTG